MEPAQETGGRRNGRVFMAYRLVSRMYFHLPILFIYLYKNDLSLTWIAVALGVYAVVVMTASDVGSVASRRWGERNVLVLAELVKAASLVVLALSPTPGGAIVGELIAGLGFCLSAGTDSVLMKKVYGADFDRLQARTQGYMFLSLLGAGAIGGVLFSWHLKAPFYVGIAPALVSAVLVGMVRLPKQAPAAAPAAQAAPSEVSDSTRPVWQWMGFYALERGVLLGMFVGLMPYYLFTELELGVGWFGVVLGCFTLAGFLSARYANRIGRLLPGRSFIVCAAAVSAVGIALFSAFDNLAASLVCLVLLGAATGIIRPITLKNVFAAELRQPTVRRVLTRMEQAFGAVNALVVVIGPLLLERVEFRWVVVGLAAALLLGVAALIALSRGPALQAEPLTPLAPDA